MGAAAGPRGAAAVRSHRIESINRGEKSGSWVSLGGKGRRQDLVDLCSRIVSDRTMEMRGNRKFVQGASKDRERGEKKI